MGMLWSSCFSCSCAKKLQETPQNEPLPELPHDALLQVFRWLHWRDLLRARAVCRGWREAALDPTLWRRISLSIGLGTRSTRTILRTRTALRVAPCLDSLSVFLISADAVDPLLASLLDAACRTDCLVSKLEADVDWWDSGCAEYFESKLEGIFQRQAQHGKLREVYLEFGPPEMGLKLMEVALTSKKLKVLICNKFTRSNLNLQGAIEPSGAPGAPQNRQVNSCSLEELQYFSDSDDPLLEFLLATHASTLESVTLADDRISSHVMELVFACPRLRAAHLFADIPTIGFGPCAPLPALTIVSLVLPESAEAWIPFFRGATKLMKLHLYSKGEVISLKSAVDLLASLGSTGRSALQLLRIEYPGTAFGRAISRALRGFPLLHSVFLPEMLPPEAMADLTQALLPSLRLLCFTGIENWEDMCSEDLCCFPGLYSMVRRIPKLHVMGLVQRHGKCPDGPDTGICDCCRQGLHFYDSAEKHLSLHGHANGCEVDTHSEVCWPMVGWGWTTCVCDTKWCLVPQLSSAQ